MSTAAQKSPETSQTAAVRKQVAEREAERGVGRAGGTAEALLALQQSAGNRAVAELLRGSSGRPLDRSTRREMEAKFGADFGDVRVHTGDIGAQVALGAGARAVTSGGHIAFSEGFYAPSRSEGKRLIAHELAHVLQQGRAGGRRVSAAGAESEARQAGSAVVAGGAAGVQAAAGGAQADPMSKEELMKVLGGPGTPANDTQPPVPSEEGPTIAQFGEDEVGELTGMWKKKLANEMKAAEPDPSKIQAFNRYLKALENRARIPTKDWFQSEQEMRHLYSLIGGKPDEARETYKDENGAWNETKPDFDAPNVRGEVKNWEMIHIQSPEAAQGQLSHLAGQVNARRNLPNYKAQTVIVDLRGQKLSEEQLQTIGKTFAERTGLPPRNIQIVTWEKPAGGTGTPGTEPKAGEEPAVVEPKGAKVSETAPPEAHAKVQTAAMPKAEPASPVEAAAPEGAVPSAVVTETAPQGPAAPMAEPPKPLLSATDAAKPSIVTTEAPPVVPVEAAKPPLIESVAPPTAAAQAPKIPTPETPQVATEPVTPPAAAESVTPPVAAPEGELVPGMSPAATEELAEGGGKLASMLGKAGKAAKVGGHVVGAAGAAYGFYEDYTDATVKKHESKSEAIAGATGSTIGGFSGGPGAIAANVANIGVHAVGNRLIAKAKAEHPNDPAKVKEIEHRVEIAGGTTQTLTEVLPSSMVVQGLKAAGRSAVNLSKGDMKAMDRQAEGFEHGEAGAPLMGLTMMTDLGASIAGGEDPEHALNRVAKMGENTPVAKAGDYLGDQTYQFVNKDLPEAAEFAKKDVAELKKKAKDKVSAAWNWIKS